MSGLMTTMTTSLTSIGSDAQTLGSDLKQLQKTLITFMQSDVFKSLPADQQASFIGSVTPILRSMAESTKDIGANTQLIQLKPQTLTKQFLR